MAETEKTFDDSRILEIEEELKEEFEQENQQSEK